MAAWSIGDRVLVNTNDVAAFEGAGIGTIVQIQPGAAIFQYGVEFDDPQPPINRDTYYFRARELTHARTVVTTETAW